MFVGNTGIPVCRVDRGVPELLLDDVDAVSVTPCLIRPRLTQAVRADRAFDYSDRKSVV